MKVILSTLNAKFIHTSLAIRLLKAYSGNNFDIELAEYTIKDPTMNIVSDLFQRRPDVIGFSCYIWNIEETIRVIDVLKKSCPRRPSSSAGLRCLTIRSTGWNGLRTWTSS